ncbi:MAG: transposase [Candidatus Aenigmatarchaeota archaeon]
MRKDVIGNMWDQQSRQNWTAYNRAQTTEFNQFDILLKDILENVDESQYKFGRPSLSLRDVLFCCVKKVYSQMSCRRSKGMLDNAAGKNLIGKSPNYTATSKLLSKKKTTAILSHLIMLSALPLKDFEEHFSVDSSGFRLTNFTPYFGDKHKVEMKHDWLKLHMCIGTHTNIITSVRITDQNGADMKEFGYLVRSTARKFKIKELSADKGYSSRKSYEIVDKIGGQALIPFKINATGKSKGSPIYHKMYHYFKFHQPEFMARYHQRSNIESTFFMLKKKFGDSLKSRNKTAQVNELLCKVLAHNLCVLLEESQESGINPDLGNNKEGRSDE